MDISNKFRGILEVPNEGTTPMNGELFCQTVSLHKFIVTLDRMVSLEEAIPIILKNAQKQFGRKFYRNSFVTIGYHMGD